MPSQKENLPVPYAVGLLMGEAIEQLLWQDSVAFGRGESLKIRIGSGQATYHRYDRKTGAHLINLGQRMIVAKQRPENCGAWLSAREILERRYFSGELSTVNLLAHTCCHEFAHLQQVSQGERRSGSVHNPAFYRLLDQLHREGRAGLLRQWLLTEGARRNLPMGSFPSQLSQHRPGPTAGDFNVGEQVYFWHGSTRHCGRILRRNRRTCSVIGEGPSRGLRFRVPPHLLTSFERPLPR